MCPRVVTYVNESTYCSRNYKEKVKPKVEDGDANYFEYQTILSTIALSQIDLEPDCILFSDTLLDDQYIETKMIDADRIKYTKQRAQSV